VFHFRSMFIACCPKLFIFVNRADLMEYDRG
jgi:hypothetical protein